MANCTFPLCKREATIGQYCYDHNRLMGKSSPQKKSEVKKPINKVSGKMKDTKAELKKKYTAFLKNKPFCDIKSPECTKVATAVNHIKGRGKNFILNEQFWEPCCPQCNSYIEQFPKFNGGRHKQSPHTKSKL